MSLREDVEWSLRTVASYYRAAGKHGEDVPAEWINGHIEKLYATILARHPEPQLQVQAQVGEHLENGGGDEREKLIEVISEHHSGNHAEGQRIADALLAAGYGLRQVPGVEAIMGMLAENGLDDNGSNPHSWRCEHPDRYPGYCTCATDLATAVRDYLLGGE